MISLTVSDVGVTYANGHQAIYEVSFALEAGMTCALVGANGSGKSTLFNAIMGIVKPQSGEVRINGLKVASALKQNAIAYVPQTEQIDWHFPILVKDVVMLGRYGYMNFMRRPRASDEEKVWAAMQRLGIAALANRQIGELSGGQKKRVFLARALAQESRVILLDEPFTGVDIKTEQAVMDLLVSLRAEGYLMLVSSHNLGAIAQYCNQVVLLNRTVIASGATQAVYTRENLEKTFGGLLKNFSVVNKQAPDDLLTIITDDEHPAVFCREGRLSSLYCSRKDCDCR